MPVLVKICGITRVEDALAALEAGADAIGFMFYPRSSRALSPATAARISRELPRQLSRVAVFVNPTEAEVHQAIQSSDIDTLQFHGNESPDFCRGFGSLRVWKAFQIKDRESLSSLHAYTNVDAWLLDSHSPHLLGGTGIAFNWDLAREATAANHPIVLAGGLTPANVAEAVRRVQPFAVDVSSGVESAPGIKDGSLIQAFVTAAKHPENSGHMPKP